MDLPPVPRAGLGSRSPGSGQPSCLPGQERSAHDQSDVPPTITEADSSVSLEVRPLALRP